MTTESDRILAAGNPVTFLDGKTYNVRFSMRAMKAVEDKYGSIPQLFRTLQASELMFGPVAELLTIALAGEGVTEDYIYDQGDPKLARVYADAALNALVEAMPDTSTTADAEEPTDPTPAVTAPPTTNGHSPGPLSTTSSQSVSVEQMTPSGV